MRSRDACMVGARDSHTGSCAYNCRLCLQLALPTRSSRRTGDATPGPWRNCDFVTVTPFSLFKKSFLKRYHGR